jgi:hypothetical protein
MNEPLPQPPEHSTIERICARLEQVEAELARMREQEAIKPRALGVSRGLIPKLLLDAAARRRQDAGEG